MSSLEDQSLTSAVNFKVLIIKVAINPFRNMGHVEFKCCVIPGNPSYIMYKVFGAIVFPVWLSLLLISITLFTICQM